MANFGLVRVSFESFQCTVTLLSPSVKKMESNELQPALSTCSHREIDTPGLFSSI